MTRRRTARAILQAICSWGLISILTAAGGCFPGGGPAEFHVRIEPARGHVPYEARIVCTPLEGTYTYELPDGSQVTDSSHELTAVVDSLTWQVTVTWSDGKNVRTDTATAKGTNARPRILRPRIGGSAELWYLEPRERTLIDFAHYEASMSGPETGVVYEGDWRVIEIRLDCPLKTVCGDIVADSVFYPPYEQGTVHALLNGQLYENACIVYPAYTGEIAPNGLPYAPAPEDGYTYDPYRVRTLYHAVAFPAQTGKIHVTVEDDWGRRTSASFEVPIGALALASDYGDPTEYEDAVLYVAEVGASEYHLSTCPYACSIAPSKRLYFAEQRNAEAAGLQPATGCL